MTRSLRIALRTWYRTPGVALVTLLSLVAAIGAATVTFALAYGVLVRPLPFPESGRLAFVTSYSRRDTNAEIVDNSNRMSQFLDWQQHAASFEDLAAWSGTSRPDVYTVSGRGTPERVSGLRVTERLLPMLGAQAAVGRLFITGDDNSGAARVAVLSQGYWTRRFGAHTDIVGQTIKVENQDHVVVGVVAQEFPLSGTLFGSEPIDIYLPLNRDPAADNIGAFMTVLGRLRSGTAIEHAEAELATRRSAIASATGRPWMEAFQQRVVPAQTLVTRGAPRPLLILAAAVGCVVLMVFVNVGNLMLVRVTRRRREMQVRAALGASRRQVLFESIAETAAVAAPALTIALASAAVLTRWMRVAVWLPVPRLAEIRVDATAVGFAFALTLLVVLALAVLAMLSLRRRDIGSFHGVASGADRRTIRLQRMALSAQVAFALVLTVAGGLLLQSFVRLLQVDAGYRPEGAVALRIDPAGRLAPAQRAPFFMDVLDRVSSVPGVESAAIAIGVPMDRNFVFDVLLPGERAEPGQNRGAAARLISPRYFRTVGIRLIQGRDFDSRDKSDAPLVVAVNETLARRLTALGHAAVGTTINVTGRNRQIVAVVNDVRGRALATAEEPEVYIPFTQQPGWQAYDLVVRTAGDPVAVIPSVRQAIWRVDRQQAIGAPMPLQQLIERTIRPQRLLSGLLSGFAASALILAALGIYGIVRYRVAARIKDVAIRVAVGATGGDVTWHVMRDTVVFVLLGVAAGLPLALLSANAVRAFLFAIEPRDPVTLTVALVVVTATGVAAALFPARRAARVDPMRALRSE